MIAIDPTKPATDLLPTRAASIRGAGLSWTAATRELSVVVGSKRDDRRFRVRELAGIDRAEFAGRAFALDKVTPGTDRETTGYVLLVSDRGPGWDSCECRGFLRHGHCCHLDAMRTILTNGWFDVPHPCDTPEYDAMSAAVDAAAPDPVPAGPLCVLCHQPLADGTPIDPSALAHQTCSDAEWADIHAGWEASVAAGLEASAGTPADDVPF